MVESSSSYGTVRMLNRDVGFLLDFVLVLLFKSKARPKSCDHFATFFYFMVCTWKEIYAL